jgi:hypothetical protein
MAKVVNLNRYRKKRVRDERQKTAEANRVKYGRTKGERMKDQVERERTRAEIDAKRLESDEPEGPTRD